MKIFRLGLSSAYRTRPRLIKVICMSIDQASCILRSANSLKSNDRFKDIRIFSDRTKLQATYIRSLKEDVQSCISKGESNLYIKYINGIPKILHKPSLAKDTNNKDSGSLN